MRHHRLDAAKSPLLLFGTPRRLVVIRSMANCQKDINPTNYAMPVA